LIGALRATKGGAKPLLFIDQTPLPVLLNIQHATDISSFAKTILYEWGAGS